MQGAIGQQVYLRDGDGCCSLLFLCTVVDVKTGWGKPRFLVTPVSGKGERWVEFSSIEPVKSEISYQSNAEVTVNKTTARLTPSVTCVSIKKL